MRLLFVGILLPLAVAGCVASSTNQAVEDVSSAAAGNSERLDDSDRSMKGLAFAQAHCAACHDVTGDQISPNDQAPNFAAIANSRGLTGNSLSTWLRDSHNYPDMMDFEINAQRIDDLAAYMLTLKSPTYQPPIQ